MGSRIKKNPCRLFDSFLEVVRPSVESDKDAWILQSFPYNYKDKNADVLKPVPTFAFPCHIDITTVQNFSFVLTDVDAQWTFGYCRQAPGADTALVILSAIPWHDLFFRILNNAGELSITGRDDDAEMWRFVEACYSIPRLPMPGSVFHVSWESKSSSAADFTCSVPALHDLPTLPENRNLFEYFNAVGLDTMLEIFASMLHERRILVTSRRLHRLSACVQAANAIIYPMFWQHIFIPILPKQLMGYLQAPMPYLIGVPSPVMKNVRLDELGDVVILDADANKITSPYRDLLRLPDEVVANFRRAQKLHGRDLAGDNVARLFLRAIVHLIGGYRGALKMRPGEKIIFDDRAFIATRSQSVQPFLESILELQIFRQFIEDRLQMLNEGKGGSDEFEKEIVFFAEKMVQANNAGYKIKTQAAAIGTSVKKEGGAIVKAVKTNVNPAVKQAVKSVRAGSKSAYKGVKSKIRENNSASNLKSLASTKFGRSGTTLYSESNGRLQVGTDLADLPQSAPTSPTLSRSIADGYSTGGSCNTNSSDSGSHRVNRMFRTSTDIGFVAPVLKYERFDPPKLTYEKTSPEFETMPPLNLDLMSEMQDVINRKPSPLQSAAHLRDAPILMDPTPIEKQSPPDLISFQLDRNEEHEIVFDPLAEQSPPVAAPRRSSIQKNLPHPPPLTTHHRPLTRSSNVSNYVRAEKPLIQPQSNPRHPNPPPPSRSSDILLQEYGIHFDNLSVSGGSSSVARPLGMSPPTKDCDPFADLDPLKSRSLSTVVCQGTFPVAPPRTKKMSLDPNFNRPNNRNGWTTFD